MAGDFFFGQDIKALSFGFSIKLDSFQKEYFEKSLDTFLDLQGTLPIIEEESTPKSIVNTIQILLFNKILDEPILLKKIKNAIFDKYRDIIARFDHKAELIAFLKEEIFGEFLKEYPKVGQILNIDNIAEHLFDGINDSLRAVIDKTISDTAGGTFTDQEVFLPIFIGHNEIPQLSWGHAKYAHYMNEKGFNFFKFKHADHLPKKIRKDESFEN